MAVASGPAGPVLAGPVLRRISQLRMRGTLNQERFISRIPYSGYFSGGKIFVSSEFLDSSWRNFRGRGILNHTPVLCGTVSWVKISWLASQPRKP